MTESLDDARAQVVDTCRRAARHRLVIGTAGNVSLRVGNEWPILVTATGVDFATIDASHVVAVDLHGRVVDGAYEPTSEVGLHLDLHRAAGPDGARAVVHTHAPMSTALSTVLESLPVIHYQQLSLGGEVRVAPYATFGSAELAAHVAEALEDRQAALMANHGSVALGATLDKALDHALLLEWLCGVYRDASIVGTPRVLSDAEQTAVVEAAIARKYGTVQPIERSPE